MSISVIIPCYNGWTFLKNCLEALEKQSEKIEEIIIVDDCSTDNSFKNLEKFAAESSLNIKLIQNEQNLGPGKSREKGIQASTSEYIAFCDCDDWYEKDFSFEVKNEIRKSKCDLLIFDMYTTFDSGRKKREKVTSQLISGDTKGILASNIMSLCCMVVKRELIKEVKHSNLRHAEDGVVAIQLIMNAKKIQILDKPLYNYYFRENSASKKPSNRASRDMLEAFKLIHKNADKNFEKEIEFIGINYICYGSMICGAKAHLSSYYLNDIINEFESIYPRWVKNEYIKKIGKFKQLFLKLVNLRIFFLIRLLTMMHPMLAKIKRKI